MVMRTTPLPCSWLDGCSLTAPILDTCYLNILCHRVLSRTGLLIPLYMIHPRRQPLCHLSGFLITDDICNIIEQMPHEYAESAWSVCLMLSIPGEKSPWVVFYHFSKAHFHLAQKSRDEVQHWIRPC